MTIRIAPTLAGMATYPFVRLEEARRRLLDEGVEVIDFGKGDPNEPTDPVIRKALVDALPERSPYPLAQGLPELRSAVAGWCERRFGVALDPDTEIVPTYGSKEAIYSLAQVLVDPSSDKRTVLFGEPAYPVYERGALVRGRAGAHGAAAARARIPAGAATRSRPCARQDGDLLGQLPEQPDRRRRAALVLRAALRARAERYDFAIASDEAYSELWFDEPPPSALQVRGPLAHRSSSRRSASARR